MNPSHQRNSIMGREVELDNGSLGYRMFGSITNRRTRSKIDMFMRRHKDLVQSDESLKDIIDLFCTWSKNTKKEDDKEYCDDVFNYIVERLYKSEFNESEYVARSLMFYLKKNDMTMASLLSLLDFPMCAVHFKAYIHSETNILTDVDRHTLFEYFIRHSHAAKLIIDGKRLLQLKYHPNMLNFESVIQMVSWSYKRLHIVLRYGALFSVYDEYYVKHAGNLTCNFTAFIIKIFEDYLKKFSALKSSFFGESLAVRQEIMYNKIHPCYNLILSDIPNWAVSLSTLCEHIQANADGEEKEIETYLSSLVPVIKNYFTNPMDLKQICRLSIRRALNANWQLPHGIYSLPLPASVKKYIDCHKFQ